MRFDIIADVCETAIRAMDLAEFLAKESDNLFAVVLRVWEGNKRITLWFVREVDSSYISSGAYENEVALYGEKGRIR